MRKILLCAAAGILLASALQAQPLRLLVGTLTDEERAQLAAILDKLNSGFEKELGLPEDPQERKEALRRKSAG